MAEPDTLNLQSSAYTIPGKAENTAQKNCLKQRYDYLDLLKCIAIFLVVFVHFNSLPYDLVAGGSKSKYINYFLNALCCSCVPIFFFVNGALLLNKTLDLRKHIKKALNILVLTYVWGFITFYISASIDGAHLTLGRILASSISFEPGYGAYLWFMRALFAIYLIFPLVKTCYDENKYFKFFLWATLILTFGMSFASQIGYLLGAIFKKQYLNIFLQNFFFNPFTDAISCALSYFILGGILFTFRDKLNTRKYKLMSLLAIPVSTLLWMGYGIIRSIKDQKMYPIANTGYDSIFALTIVVSFFILFLGYKKKNMFDKLICLIGKNSLGIYLLHIIIGHVFGHVFSPLLSQLPVKEIVNVLLNFALTIANMLICLVICLLLKKVPVIKKLFSL